MTEVPPILIIIWILLASALGLAVGFYTGRNWDK